MDGSIGGPGELLRSEIAEQPAAWRRLLGEGRESITAAAALLREHDPELIVFAARGTSDHAAMYAQYLAQVRGLSPDTRVRLGRELANEAAIYVSPLPAVDAELFLAAVAALRRDREFAALQLEKRRLEQLKPVLSGLPHRFPRR